MITRAQFVGEARTWLDTPYRHQGRLKGVSVDCVGLVIGVAQALGLSDFDVTDYDKRPDGTLQVRCEAHMMPIPRGDALPGDVLLFHWANNPIHLAILTDENTIIHAYLPNRKVVEHGIDAKWWGQVKQVYRVPGVE